jgi:hypothetical protein
MGMDPYDSLLTEAGKAVVDGVEVAMLEAQRSSHPLAALRE